MQCLFLACFLLSLVDHEEIDELDISDLVDNNTSVFASLLTNAEKMKVCCLMHFFWEKGELSYGLQATGHGMHACFLAHPKQGKTVITMKNTTCSKKSYFLTKQESIYFVPCPTESSNLTEGASLFCPKQKEGRDFYPTVASLSPNVSLVPLGGL